jgi:ferritin-like metal-binding protein YciE
MHKRAGQLEKKSKLRIKRKSETESRVEIRQDELHKRIQSKLDELHADFRQLGTDLRASNQASSRARKDRIAGFKQALRDLLEAADRSEREWH